LNAAVKCLDRFAPVETTAAAMTKTDKVRLLEDEKKVTWCLVAMKES